jgi:predicted phage terminase large subunit-like protein
VSKDRAKADAAAARRRVLLHPVQRAFLDSPAVFRGYVGGRGSGKSWIGAYDLIVRAQAKPGRLYMVVGPTYGVMKDTSLRSFLALAEALGVLARPFNNSSMTATFANGSEVVFRSGDDPERLRGPNLSGVWLDEASVMAKDAYLISIGSLRERGEQGWLSATFTPKGKQHWTYEVFGPQKETGRPRANTGLFHSATRDNPFLPETFEETVRGEYSPAFAEQELGGAFIDPQGSLFKKKWLRYYTRRGEYYVLSGLPMSPVDSRSCRRFQTVDLAFSEREAADYTVVATWDDDRRGNLILANVFRERVHGLKLSQALEAQWRAWRPLYVAVESNGFESVFSVIEGCRARGMPVRKVTADRDKVTRSLAAQVKAESGQLYLPEAAPWLPDFEAELLSFPESPHDDQVDAFSYAADLVSTLYRQYTASRPIAGEGMGAYGPGVSG